ncbi:Glycerol-3-phosphate ABC transporter, permease protein UgpA [Salinisphaera sp. LB1]|nr:sugar ABC transporter permease [Salinisphaera sp. LB1]AWN15812.1 Glycerol-3-phosphate ABC transporter, permease protein UgpA [Salinisphaera sp. LB1]
MAEKSSSTKRAESAGVRAKAWSRRAIRRKNARSALLMIAPFLVVYGVFLIYPAIRVFWLTFTSADLTGNGGAFVGLDNYTRLIFDPLFWASVWHTVYFVLLTAAPSTAVGLLLAILVLRWNRLRPFFLAAFFLPYILPVSVVTMIWAWILDPNFGVANYLFGTNIAWLDNASWAMPMVAFVTIWWMVGFNTVLFISGLQNIPNEIYEAARLDGCGPVRLFTSITWPMLYPVTVLVFTLQLILQFKIFNQVYLLTHGGPYNSTIVLLQYMYRQAFNQHNGGYAATISVSVFVLILVTSFIQYRLLSSRKGSDA